MHDRHTNRERYFREQNITTEKYIIPYLKDVMNVNEHTTVLEIGCGEGGNLKPFLDLGCKRVVGIDLSTTKIELANKFFADHPNKEKIEFIADDIYNTKKNGGKIYFGDKRWSIKLSFSSLILLKSARKYVSMTALARVTGKLRA